MSSESGSGQAALWEGAQAEANPDPVATGPEEREPRLKQVNRNQLLLRTVDVEKLVEPDHLVRAIWELVRRLDLSRFHQGIQAVEGIAGRPAWDPQLLISLWIYAYSEGVSSARADLAQPPGASAGAGSADGRPARGGDQSAASPGARAGCAPEGGAPGTGLAREAEGAGRRGRGKTLPSAG